jgi:rSAM/selenodomain-associated transferase 2
MSLAIIIPALNEAAVIEAALQELQPLRRRGTRIVMADGGSSDDTAQRAGELVDALVVAARGRARQMNAGAQAASGADVLLFLHADTRLPADADRLVTEAVASGARWGRFDVRIAGRAWLLGLVAHAMNLRSRLTGICTGDQAIFCRRELFESLGGYAELPLMEDVDFSTRARRLAAPAALRAPAITSGRRWEEHGVVRTVVKMWSLRWRFQRGADPAALAREYRDVR